MIGFARSGAKGAKGEPGNIELGYAQINAPVPAGPSLVVDLGMNVTVNLDGTRPVVIKVDVPYIYHTAAGGLSRIEIVRTDTGQVIQQGVHHSAIANHIGNVHIERRLMLPAGQYTFKARLRNSTATVGQSANVFATDDAGTQNAGNAIVPSIEAVLV